MTDMLRKTLSRDGLRGVYRGLACPMILVGLQKSVAFGVYGTTCKYLQGGKQEPSLTDVAIAGAAGGIANTALLTPIDQVKIKMQMATSMEKTARQRFVL